MIYTVIIWCLFGIGAMLIASSRGANTTLWFFLGMLLGPFGLLFALFSGGKQCPYCKSKIHKDALMCPRCQQKLDIPTKNKTTAQINANKDVFIYLLSIMGIGVMYWVISTIYKILEK